MEKPKWLSGDRVVATFHREKYAGTVLRTDSVEEEATVAFDDGDVLTVDLNDLLPELNKADPDDSLTGFNQYKIAWDDDIETFQSTARSVDFYGRWREGWSEQDQAVCWFIDIFVEHTDHNYGVKSIGYYTEDPRKNLRSLNADICAALSQWLHQRVAGRVEMFDDLRARANSPVVKIKSLEYLDELIHKLTAWRTVAWSSKQCFHVMQPEKSDTAVTLVAGFGAKQKGKKPPPLKSKQPSVTKKKRAPVSSNGESKDIKRLLKQLKDSSNKNECRKLRIALRKLGHRGGVRSSSS